MSVRVRFKFMFVPDQFVYETRTILHVREHIICILAKPHIYTENGTCNNYHQQEAELLIACVYVIH